jgi:flagellar biosynthesis GTPase FlhF
MSDNDGFDSEIEESKMIKLRQSILKNQKQRKYGLLSAKSKLRKINKLDKSDDSNKKRSTDSNKKQSTDSNKKQSTDSNKKQSTDSNKKQSTNSNKKQSTDSNKKQVSKQTNKRRDKAIANTIARRPITRQQKQQYSKDTDSFVSLDLDASESSDASETLNESDYSDDTNESSESSGSLADFIESDESDSSDGSNSSDEWDSTDDEKPTKRPHVTPTTTTIHKPVTTPQQLYSPKLNYVDFVTRKEKAERLIASREPCLSDIIDIDNISDEERATLLEQLYKLNTFTKYSEEHIAARDKLWDKIKMFNSRKPIPEELSLNASKLEVNLSDRILNSHLPLEYKKIVYQKYLMLEKMNSTNEEYNKLLVWILTALEIPFGKYISLREGDTNQINQFAFLNNVMKSLNEQLYGMTYVKNEILMIVNNMLTNPMSPDRNIALIGEPGVGKTKIVRCLSSILNIPFCQISLGGVNNVGFITGDSYAFIGSKCGKIVQALTEMKCMNGIIFFDEIDKLADTAQGNEVSNALLHIIDSTQNKEFCDNFFTEFKIDLSKIWFIFSLNDESKIDHILRDRLNLIHIKGYSKEDKMQIFKDYLVPRELNNVGLSVDQIQFSNEAVEYMITHLDKTSTKPEAGVRSLMFKTTNLIKRINLLRVLNENKANVTTNARKRKSINDATTPSDFHSIPFYIENFKLPRVISRKDMERLMSE